MPFAPGDRVHFLGVGTGTVRETRGRDRYAVEIKGRMVVASSADLEAVTDAASGKRRRGVDIVAATDAAPLAAPPSLDLHGRSVLESVVALEAFIDDALRNGHEEVRVVHGQSGGRVRAAVHDYLRKLPVVRAFRIDPRNAGVTIVSF